MGSLSTLNLIKTSVVAQRTTLPSAAKLNLPSQCFTISKNYLICFGSLNFTDVKSTKLLHKQLKLTCILT